MNSKSFVRTSTNLNSVSRFTLVDQVIVKDDVNRAGQLTGWRLLRHLLNGYGLVILVYTQPILSLQKISWKSFQKIKYIITGKLTSSDMTCLQPLLL